MDMNPYDYFKKGITESDKRQPSKKAMSKWDLDVQKCQDELDQLETDFHACSTRNMVILNAFLFFKNFNKVIDPVYKTQSESALEEEQLKLRLIEIKIKELGILKAKQEKENDAKKKEDEERKKKEKEEENRLRMKASFILSHFQFFR